MDEFEELPEITTGGSSAILSSLYRTILLSLGVNAPLFSKLIYKYCCKVMNSNTGKSFNTRNILRTKENALVKRLIEPKFSFDTFLIGLNVINVEYVELILTFEQDDGTVVERVTSDKISTDLITNNVKGKSIGNTALYNFLNSIIKHYNMNFDQLYELIKKKYKNIATNKAGKCFVSNLARDYRNESITWVILYRILTVFGYNRGTVSVVLTHNNDKQSLFKKSFIIH